MLSSYTEHVRGLNTCRNYFPHLLNISRYYHHHHHHRPSIRNCDIVWAVTVVNSLSADTINNAFVLAATWADTYTAVETSLSKANKEFSLALRKEKSLRYIRRKWTTPTLKIFDPSLEYLTNHVCKMFVFMPKPSHIYVIVRVSEIKVMTQVWGTGRGLTRKKLRLPYLERFIRNDSVTYTSWQGGAREFKWAF